MRHFLHAVQNADYTDIVIALMQRQRGFNPTNVDGVTQMFVPQSDLPSLTRLTLTLMMSAETLGLRDASVYRVGPAAVLPLNGGQYGFCVVLYVQDGKRVMLAAGAEAVYVGGRGIWNFSDIGEGAQLINKSEDDVLALMVYLDIDARVVGLPAVA